jgi:NAD(P)-dependent dehydrogenase (short-subunit alcohol dehydrogenase family)
MHEKAKQLFDLTGKIAVVTGAGSGIGKAIAEAMGESGAKVVCADINEENARETAMYVNGLGSSAIAVRADVSEEADVKGMVDKTVEQYGKLDILFNIAGIPHLPAKVHEFPRRDWDRIIAVNLTGTFLCCKEALRIMLKQKSGKIINMSSTVATRGSKKGCAPGMCAARGAVTVLTKDMAVAYADMGIQVNALAPGSFRTNIGAQLFKDLSYDEVSKMIFADEAQVIPMKRVGEPPDIKGAAIFLASKASDYITGHILVVDGGKLSR